MKTCFIVGCGRSGSTWLNELLTNLPTVSGGAENNFFHKMAAPILRNHREGVELNLYHYGINQWIARDKLVAELSRLWGVVTSSAIKHDTTCLVDQTPHNGLYLNEVVELVPQASFIFLYRDPRYVCRSLVKAGSGWGSYWAPTTYQSATQMWNRRNQAVVDWLQKNDSANVFMISYEELVSDTTQCLSRIVEWMGLSVELVTPPFIEAAVEEASRKKMREKFAKTKATSGEFVGSGKLEDSFMRQQLTDAYISYKTRKVRSLLEELKGEI